MEVKAIGDKAKGSMATEEGKRRELQAQNNKLKSFIEMNDNHITTLNVRVKNLMKMLARNDCPRIDVPGCIAVCNFCLDITPACVGGQCPCGLVGHCIICLIV